MISYILIALMEVLFFLTLKNFIGLGDESPNPVYVTKTRKAFFTFLCLHIIFAIACLISLHILEREALFIVMLLIEIVQLVGPVVITSFVQKR